MSHTQTVRKLVSWKNLASKEPREPTGIDVDEDVTFLYLSY